MGEEQRRGATLSAPERAPESGRVNGEELDWAPELVEGLYALLYDGDPAGEGLAEGLLRLQSRFGEAVYAELIYLMSHLRFEPHEAFAHWQKILSHHEEMQRRLAATVDLRVALASYFIDVNRQLRTPKIIELKLFEQTRESAYRDVLTGLHNYRLFREYLDQELKRSDRCNSPLSLVMIDIDNFKAYNDRNGHEGGNEVLATIARILNQSLRQGDVAARYGGEEFALILPMTPKMAAQNVTERARDQIARHPFADSLKGTTTVTVSAGIATFPADARDVAQLVRQADRAMYVAKASGKNQVQLYGQSRRSYRRVAASLEGEYRVLVAESHRLTTVNVSEKGVRFYADRPLPVGALLDFRLALPDSQKVVNACGRIVHVKRQPDGRFQAAVRITDMDPQDEQSLLSFLRESD
jgi:diguanylate cyclase (GGDEF)-like protein